MVTKAEIQKRLDELPDNDDQYAVTLFDKNDILGLAVEADIKLTPAEAKELLLKIDSRPNNKEKGITVETLKCHIASFATGR